MAHRKWKEIKQQLSMLPGPAVPGCCLVSFHFLWAILSTSTVEDSKNIKLQWHSFVGRHPSLASLHQHGRLPPANRVPLRQADGRRDSLHRSGQEDVQHVGSRHPRPQSGAQFNALKNITKNITKFLSKSYKIKKIKKS